MDELRWFVAHTRARREKKLVDYCEREGFKTTLPCYRAVHKYRGKTVVFDKPLFPNYVFLRLLPPDPQKVLNSDHVVRVLKVDDQALFEQQLQDILKALDAGVELRLVPEIGQGSRVRIKDGPLRGMEAFVEKRYGMTTVLLRVDFIGQAAAVKLEAHQLELS